MSDILSVGLGLEYDTDLLIEGKHLDACEDSAATIPVELFPLTATDETISNWERVYDINPVSGATLDDRRQAVAAKHAAVGGLNKAFFESIVTQFKVSGTNYQIGTHAAVGDPHIRFLEGEYPAFRADVSEADNDAIWDQDEGSNMYTVRVLGTSVESQTTMQTILSDLRPAGIEFVYVDE